MEFEFKKFSSKVTWNTKLLLKFIQISQMSPLGEFIVLIIGFTGITIFYSVKQFKE